MTIDDGAMDVQQIWKGILAYYDERLDNYSDRLKPGANMEMITEMEKSLDQRLPDDLIKVYMMHNGDSTRAAGSILGMQFLSLEEMYETRHAFELLSESDKTEPRYQYGEDPGMIVEHSINWLPFASDHSGYYIGVDMDSETPGPVGQVIVYGQREGKPYVAARSFREFLERMLGLLLELRLDLSLDEERDVAKIAWRNDQHPVDALKAYMLSKNA